MSIAEVTWTRSMEAWILVPSFVVSSISPLWASGPDLWTKRRGRGVGRHCTGPLVVLKPRNPMSRSGSSGLKDRRTEGGLRVGVYIWNQLGVLEPFFRPKSTVQASVAPPAVVDRGSGARLQGWSLFSAMIVGLEAAHSGGSWYILSWEVRALREAQGGPKGLALHFLSGACFSAFPEHAVFPHVSVSIKEMEGQMPFFAWISCSNGSECPHASNMYWTPSSCFIKYLLSAYSVRCYKYSIKESIVPYPHPRALLQGDWQVKALAE